MLGNLFFLLTAICYFGLIATNFSHPPSGDRGVGYGFMMFVCGAGFAISTLLLTLAVGWKNGFDWVAQPGGKRTLLVGAGWLALAAGTFFCAIFKWEWHVGEFPIYLRWLAKGQAEIWLPLLMLVPAFLLLHVERQAGVAPLFIKIPMLAGFAVSVVVGLGLLFGWFRGAAQRRAAIFEHHQTQNDKLHQEHLDQIAKQTLADPILNLMPFTGRFHENDIRDAALAKVKAHPDWEAQLLELLDNEYYHTEVYTFIDGNRVEHPELFVEPLNRSIRRLAAEIKNRITGSNNLQDWHFEHFSMDRLFRALDEQFMVPGANYRPTVLELRKALDTPKPERFQKVRFTVTPLVDEWLKKHS